MRQLLLDTNALIALSDPSHALFRGVEQRLRAGASAATCSIAWNEYVRGPLLEADKERALRVIESKVYPLERGHAELAADLFNASGRRRGSTADCLIAAVTIAYEAELLTRNKVDFEVFVSHGLRLAEIQDN